MTAIQSLTLNDHVDASVVATEGICGDTGEECRVASLGSLDAQVGKNSICQNLLPNRVTGIALCVQPLVVHVPQDSNGFLTLRLALQYRGFSTTGGLIPQLDLEMRRS